MIILTGSIATGKSSTCSFLKKEGYEIVDADKIAREVIDKGVIKALFGSKYIKNGDIDRKALGDLIFKDAKKREILNDYIHPLIREKIYKIVAKLRRDSKKYIVDIPLYFEGGGYDASTVALVYCPKHKQIERLMRRNNLDRDEATRRVETQMDIEEKRKKADYIIDNSKDLDNLEIESRKFIKYLESR